MKNSLIIVAFFAVGVVFGMHEIIPEFLLKNDFSSYALYLLIFLVGIDVGSDSSNWKMLKSHKMKILLIPLTTIIGTLIGAGLISFVFHTISVKDSLAVGAGFGYYSLSSIVISQMAGKTLGVIALLANVTREIFTLLFTPILEKLFGKLAPIVSGGATSMDTTLPIISKYSGKKYILISVFHGTVLTILVPIIVTIILKIF
ncbi:MAG: lysine exporter LysO family protein [Candidatus Cloacimonetes bacterium]|nr:lysine exporter LysO family protein [Candidatus Cloacimonadota bacterium]MCF7813806.1 lysine exporter LysO family protein [Candidatus Cloacimonadota bacterium]MCF7868485.1 lysine exporter LysO family protein [Candidatus Cloacimonadota bacterium]